MSRVIGLGGGGHAKVVVDILRLDGRWEVIGVLDPDPRLAGASVLGVPVLGDDSLLPELVRDGTAHAFIGVGSTGDAGRRRLLFALANETGLEVVDAVHPAARISSAATVGPGFTAMAGAVVNAEARLGANVIVNTGAIVEHDCVLGDHVHIATGARLAGAVTVAEGAHVGLGASVREGVTIGRNAMVGAGAVVVADVPDGEVVAGVPARPLDRRGEA